MVASRTTSRPHKARTFLTYSVPGGASRAAESISLRALRVAPPRTLTSQAVDAVAHTPELVAQVFAVLRHDEVQQAKRATRCWLEVSRTTQTAARLLVASPSRVRLEASDGATTSHGLARRPAHRRSRSAPPQPRKAVDPRHSTPRARWSGRSAAPTRHPIIYCASRPGAPNDRSINNSALTPDPQKPSPPPRRRARRRARPPSRPPAPRPRP